MLCDNVASFTIQWVYWDPSDKKLRWYPSDDPDGNGDPADSHFDVIEHDQFGVYFNTPGIGGVTSPPVWYNMKSGILEYRSGIPPFHTNFYPRALKFTFKIYDSKGIIEKGKTFTHIVYIGD